MPGKLKVRVVAARDLPVMDRASELTDAFVEVKFTNTTYKTDVCRKSLHPHWNSEWYRFEVDDEDLQDEPLQIRVLDHDTYSAHDAIGKVYIDLNPLLTKERTMVINGWFPIFDTMHGIRGELCVMVKLDLFSDFNKFRQSSCGVQFLCTSSVPEGNHIHAVHGFVEELVVIDDPEYQWIDKIRSMRASNEARQVQFSKLSGELQRKIGLKVLEMGGNAVIGYRQCFDLEGESGIVVRAIGTSVSLVPLQGTNTPPHSASPGKELLLPGAGDPAGHRPLGHSPTYPSFPSHSSGGRLLPSKRGSLPNAQSLLLPHSYSFPLPEDFMAASPSGRLSSFSPTKAGRRSSDSDIGTPPKGSLTGSSGSGGAGGLGGSRAPFHRPVIQQESIDMLEYPFFTVKTFPPGFLVHLGGVVSARSVKLLDRIHNPDEPETRDAWWMELRTEVRSHARALGCHAVVGYIEHSSICDEIIVLSAYGTAAIVNLSMSPQQALVTMSLDRQLFDKEKEKIVSGEKTTGKLHVDVNLANQFMTGKVPVPDHIEGAIPLQLCSLCHIPYNENSLPFPVSLNRCAICRKQKVPDVLFTTIEPPVELPLIGKGCLIQARICRSKKDASGESNAKEVSDCLPFMEYELHSQLLNKLKVKGMNTLYGLRIQFIVGDKLIIAVATATGVFSAPLPCPQPIMIVGKSSNSATDQSIQELQKKLTETCNKNKEIYNLNIPEWLLQDHSPQPNTDDLEAECEMLNDIDLTLGSKETFVLEVDDVEDVDGVSVLLDPPVPEGFEVCNTERMPGVANLVNNLQMFTRVWRGQVKDVSNKGFSQIFDNMFRSLYFKLRTMAPCALCHINFDVDIPEEDEVQVSMTGMCIGIGEPPSISNGLISLAPEARSSEAIQKQTDQDEMQFHMEMASESSVSRKGHSRHSSQVSEESSSEKSLSQKDVQFSDDLEEVEWYPVHTPKLVAHKKVRYHSGTQPCLGVVITPLPFLPGTSIVQYLGYLNFFIIRETTSVREEGGLNGFLHSFLAEVLAICRAHVAALNGNALVCFQMTECVLEGNLHKNQSQCLINVYGDVVQVAYGIDLRPSLPISTDSAGSTPRLTGVSPHLEAQNKAITRTKSASPSSSPAIVTE